MDNFKDLLWQCGSSKILGFINNIAEFSVRMTNNYDLDSCITFLDYFFYNANPNKAYVYSVITSNYGTNTLLEDTINVLLLQHKMRNEILDKRAKINYNRLLNNLIKNKKVLYEYEGSLSNKITR